MRELFVYYRVRPGDADAVRACVERVQSAAVAEFPGLQARVLRRPPAPGAGADALQTWMEIYAVDTHAPGEGVTESMQAAIEAHAERLAGLIEGVRHIEVFETIEPARP